MVPQGYGVDYIGQKVDFAFEFDNNKIAIEIDGEQHNEPKQRETDTNRRKLLRDMGWTVIEIPAHDVRNGISEDIRVQIKNYFNNYNLSSNNFNKYSEVFVKTPIAIARIQFILIDYLLKGKLSLNDNQWSIGIIERDVPCGEIALTDFFENIKNLFELSGLTRQFPKINLVIFNNKDFADFKENNVSKNESLLKIEYKDISNLNENFSFDFVIDISINERFITDELNSGFYHQLVNENGNASIIRSVYYPFDERKIKSDVPIMYDINDTNINSLKFFLRNIFRKQDFWPGQIHSINQNNEIKPGILNRSLALEPVIGLLPTGAGKSLTYQLSALLQPGMTLVVDPLRSLMFDQADNLKSIMIDNINFINSEQSPEERETIINEMTAGKYQLVFISPERLQIKKFREQLLNLVNYFSIPYLVIDEAHCVSEWGHDFRTSYLSLANTAREFCNYRSHEPIVLALTGTASYSVLTDVQIEIGIDDEESKIYPDTFNRAELKFDIKKIPSANKMGALGNVYKNFLTEKFNLQINEIVNTDNDNKCSGLVFVPHVNGEYGIDVKSKLVNGLKISPNKVEFYSGEPPNNFESFKKKGVRENLWDAHKHTVQNKFKKDQLPLLVSTKAFGMGIDKSNIRYTIHFGIPHSLESFYQEAGRAGRDRINSYCIILFSDDSPENANQFLDLTKSMDELLNFKEPAWIYQGDAHRVLYFHKKAFQGIKTEKLEMMSILKEFIYPQMAKIGENETIQKLIPFGDNNIKDLRDKCVYRLTLIGVISNYTRDYEKHLYEIEIKKLDDNTIINNLKNYVKRYKPGIVDNIEAQVRQRVNGNNFLEKCLGYLIEFIYKEIEIKRRAAIKTMVETARESSAAEDKDKAIRERLLAYLEKSMFTDMLLDMVNNVNFEQWWEILSYVDDIDKARQLLGGCQRIRESHTGYPGLYILISMSRMLLPNPVISTAIDDFKTGLDFIKKLFVNDNRKQIDFVMGFIKEYKKHIQITGNEFYNILLDEFPIREVAINLLDSIPEKSLNILINKVNLKIKSFNKQYLGGLLWMNKQNS